MNTREIVSLNGKLTKREVVRRMARRAMADENTPVYSIGYVARRIGKTVPQTKQFLSWMNQHTNIELGFSKRSVVFATN